MTKFNGNKFAMAGTEGTGEYVVIAATARGRIGVRVLSGGLDKLTHADMVRVRVEPSTTDKFVKQMSEVLPANKWKQPGEDGQHRFSRVINNGKSKGKNLRLAVTKGLLAIGTGELQKVEVNPNAPAWAQDLAASL